MNRLAEISVTESRRMAGLGKCFIYVTAILQRVRINLTTIPQLHAGIHGSLLMGGGKFKNKKSRPIFIKGRPFYWRDERDKN